ncbi:hypothetical protein ACTXPE_04775 [Psychrobacter celer]|uniref:hypothetical protein n=1 Tax=Psychrobacter celer TaxID=306572 RepID=UPI003FD039C5
MQGLQVFNDLGQIVFDTNTKTIKVLANFKIVPNMDRTFTHSLLATDSPFYIITPVATGNLIDQITITKLSNGFRVQTNNLRMSNGSLYPNANFLEITIGVY